MMVNAWSLLTAERWMLLALLLIGMIFGICIVGLYRMWFGVDQNDLPTPDLREEKRRLRKIGAATSGVFTACIVFVYLMMFVQIGAIVSVLATVGSAVIAAAANRPLFKLGRLAWLLLHTLGKKRITDAGGDISDLDDTDFKRK